MTVEFHAHKEADRQTDMAKLIADFLSLTNAPEKQPVNAVQGNYHCLFRHLYKMQNFGLWVEFFYLNSCVIRIFDYLRTENRLHDTGHSFRYPSDSTDDVPHMRKTTGLLLCQD